MNKEISISNNKAILNFSKAFFNNTDDLLRSDGFYEVLKSFVNFHKENNTRIYSYLEKFFRSSNIESLAEEIRDITKILTVMSLDEISEKINKYHDLDKERDALLRIVEDMYDYWRKLERYSVIEKVAGKEGLEVENFLGSNIKLKEMILEIYRKVEISITGKVQKVFRQVPAGANSSIIVRKSNIDYPDYCKWLNDIPYITKVMIETPYITYTKSNKRDGFFKEVEENPIANIDINTDEYLCYPAKIADNLIYVYFHQDYITHGISASNLFELADEDEVVNTKPDGLYIFGVKDDRDLDIFYEDKENDLFIGYCNFADKKDYFGYLKKMCLTLNNIISMKKGYLPIHGAGVNVVLQNGKTANIVILGDSGAGKSESIEAFRSLAKEYIRDMTVIFDDMGSFRIKNGEVAAYGTEIGAFVRLDDLDSGYAFKQIDRSIFMNPDKVNARLIMPVADHKQIMEGYKVDFFLYANNYDRLNPDDKSISLFDNKKEAIETFKAGARMAKGTTTEEGLVKSYFANPFGPFQKQEMCDDLIENYFDKLFNSNIKVGTIRTQLAIDNMESEGPKKSARELFEIIKSL
ncbi:phosphoenolpyruvate carboxykinase [uncultured Anaerococcus sp.]|uniref:phosphoenolpyruvate carboxykinase n=1 Tax=uncultured Anaerococcus sp. TaxID=293428 RepID=UPI00280B2D12|nr:phosphoenolpyruvate carboxykinase [uncultured Anaerococcus sp.]MDU5149847.1 phosphoenolpyruvate carboxykinase [Anaerococcus prevotii]